MKENIKDFEDFSKRLHESISSYEDINIINTNEEDDFYVTDEFHFHEEDLYATGSVTYFIPKSISLKWLMDGILDIYCNDDIPGHPVQVFYGFNYIVDEEMNFTNYRYLCVSYRGE